MCCALLIEQEGKPRTYAVVGGAINGTLPSMRPWGGSALAAQEQKQKRHVLCRITWNAGAGAVAALVPVCWWAARHQNTAVFLTAMLAGILALVPTVLLTLNLAAFPWDYSLFGSLRRTPLPGDSTEGLRLRGGIVIGGHFRQTWPGVGYLFVPQGLGITIELIGAVFVPAKQIVRIARRRWRSELLIEHNCREVRGPLLLFCPGLSTIESHLPGWFQQKLQPDRGREEA